MERIGLNTIDVVSYVRSLSGRSKSHLILASDGHHYSCRTRMGEGNLDSIFCILGTSIAKYFGVLCPEQCLLRMSEGVVGQANLSKLDLLGQSRVGKPSVQGFEGSLQNKSYLANRYPADPRVDAIYDFLPGKIVLTKLSNSEDFWKMIAIDVWLKSTRRRQAVYWRHDPDRNFQAMMLNPGRGSAILEGNSFADILSFDEVVYSRVSNRTHADQVVKTIIGMDKMTIESFVDSVPRQWIAECRSECKNIVGALVESRLNLEHRLNNISKPLLSKTAVPEPADPVTLS